MVIYLPEDMRLIHFIGLNLIIGSLYRDNDHLQMIFLVERENEFYSKKLKDSQKVI